MSFWVTNIIKIIPKQLKDKRSYVINEAKICLGGGGGEREKKKKAMIALADKL